MCLCTERRHSYNNVTYYAFAENGDEVNGVIWVSLAELNDFLSSPTTAAVLNSGDYVVGTPRSDYKGPFSTDPTEVIGKMQVKGPLTEVRRVPAYGGEVQYAVLTKGSSDGKVDQYNLTDWISGNKLAEYLGAASAAAIDWKALEGGKLGQPADGYQGDLNESDYADKYVCIVTSGNKFHINGLKDEAYTLSEVFAPGPEDDNAGWEYLRLKDVNIEFAAEYYSPGLTESGSSGPGTLKNLYCILDGDYTYIVKNGLYADGFNALSVGLELSNITATTMPIKTGGIGTVLFYVGGGALVAGAVLLLAYARRGERSK